MPSVVVDLLYPGRAAGRTVVGTGRIGTRPGRLAAIFILYLLLSLLLPGSCDGGWGVRVVTGGV